MQQQITNITTLYYIYEKKKNELKMERSLKYMNKKEKYRKKEEEKFKPYTHVLL